MAEQSVESNEKMDQSTPGYDRLRNTLNVTRLELSDVVEQSNVHADNINVEAAQEQFYKQSRSLSRLSQATQTSALVAGRNASDVEYSSNANQDVSGGQALNLEKLLRDMQGQFVESTTAKEVGVVFENLTVRGFGGSKHYIKTFADVFLDLFKAPISIYYLLRGRRESVENDILCNLNGYARPGEMVLVLGKPGSGCTTFLRTIANQRSGYSDVLGEISYGGMAADNFAKRYRGEAVYCAEDDIHYPTLTVGQTLEFALETKMPNNRIPGQTKAAFKETIITLLLKMFGIAHTRDTVVGNAQMRGVSGGERKRVSIAEMMITRASILAWDNSTRGLDASTASDYAKSLRILTNLHRTTTFVSLYQASQNIYAQFDKVLVLDSGRQVYFGPCAEARTYMESLGFLTRPRQTTPDYLTGCTDAYERTNAPGIDLRTVPKSSEELSTAYYSSELWRSEHEQLLEYKAQLFQETGKLEKIQAAAREGQQQRVASSTYTINFYWQTWCLIKRQFLRKWGNRVSLIVDNVTSIVLGLVIGSLFYDLPSTSDGAFTRGGVMFIALFQNAFGAFGELGMPMVGRPITNKHKTFAFHRPAALWVAQLFVDLPFVFFKTMVFCIIVYFMAGLHLAASNFLTFFLILFVAYLVLSLIFRTLGSICPNFDYALKVAGVIILSFILTSGYLQPQQSFRPYFGWIRWLNPLYYAFDSLMANEFKDADLTCSTSQLVPYGPSYGSIENQACTLAGAVAGSTQIIGVDYISLTYGYKVSNLWRNIGILFAYAAFYLVLLLILSETITFAGAGKTITYFRKENSQRKKLNTNLQRLKQNRLEQEGGAASHHEGRSKKALTFESLNYSVPTSGGQKRLLNNIYGYVKPGTLTALMGSSGAGKTTLLDVLADRKTIGVVSGDILINNQCRGADFQRGTAYCEQLDVHEGQQTVREALRFSAYLRQPFAVPEVEKDAYVEEVLSLLELEDLADAVIGDSIVGLSVEERKRVTIGVELAAKPELLLFLDEPTSGLDSQAAFNIVRFLKKLAAHGQCILCTIHQPNATLFEKFDRLLLLQRGGETVYFGEIGKDSCTLLEYFKKNGAVAGADQNPAEFMLEAIGAGSTRAIGGHDWGKVWAASPEFVQIKKDIEVIKVNAKDDEIVTGTQEYATPLTYQIKAVLHRNNLIWWRSPDYDFTRLFNHFIAGSLAGIAFWQVGNTVEDLQNRVFVLFMATILPALIISQVEPRWDLSRTVFIREASGKMYSVWAFVIAMVLVEIPYSILCAVVYFVTFYYPVGFQSTASRAGLQFLYILVAEFFAVTLGQMMAAATPNPFIAVLLNPFILTVMILFCGIAIPKPAIPEFWRSWMYNLNPLTYFVGGMIPIELTDIVVSCHPNEFAHFVPPRGQTCLQYAKEFLDYAVGYLRYPNDTSECQYCPYTYGQDYLIALDARGYDWRWRNLAIFASFIVSNLILICLASKYLKFFKR